MNVFFAIFGFAIGLLLYRLIIAPIERKKPEKNVSVKVLCRVI